MNLNNNNNNNNVPEHRLPNSIVRPIEPFQQLGLNVVDYADIQEDSFYYLYIPQTNREHIVKVQFKGMPLVQPENNVDPEDIVPMVEVLSLVRRDLGGQWEQDGIEGFSIFQRDIENQNNRFYRVQYNQNVNMNGGKRKRKSSKKQRKSKSKKRSLKRKTR
jgi:hypothetical protein